MGPIPRFPDYKLISLEDKETVKKFLAIDRQEMSECTFSNLYVWRKDFVIGLSEMDSALIVRTFYPEGRRSCMIPFGAKDPVQLIKDMCEEMSASNVDFPSHTPRGAQLKPELYFIPHYFSRKKPGQKTWPMS